MTWPSGDVPTTDLDAGTDTPPRATFLSWAQKFNELINHFSVFMQGLMTSSNAAAARSTLAAAMSGANNDITSLSGLTTPLSIGQGGTGAATAAGARTALGLDGLVEKPGFIKAFAGSSAPAGYLALPLVPTNISRTTYADLFAAIGTTWGAGDGSTTFGCPYMPTNYAPVQANSNVGTTTTGEVKSHTHARATYNTDSGASGEIRAGGGAVAGAFTSDPTGGTANLAAGVRFLWCVKV